MRTIAIEEHFWTAELVAAPGTGPLARTDGAVLDERLRDLGLDRIASMDAAGIDVQVLSHVQPAAQGLTGERGRTAARTAITLSPGRSPATRTASRASPPCRPAIPCRRQRN